MVNNTAPSTQTEAEDGMFQPAEGVLDDARTIAEKMIKAGETHAAYPEDGRPMFHVTSDESLLASVLGDFEIDDTTIYFGFLRNADEK